MPDLKRAKDVVSNALNFIHVKQAEQKMLKEMNVSHDLLINTDQNLLLEHEAE
jgi:hypothetical protein